MKIIKIMLISILMSLILVPSSEAAKENFNRSKPHMNPADKDKAKGRATGKRQHKPVNDKKKEKVLKDKHKKRKMKLKKKDKKRKHSSEKDK